MAGGSSTILARPRSESVVTRHGNLRAMEPPSRLKWEILMMLYAKLKQRGVKFDIEKMETPVCWMAQFRDPDGNKLVIHKRKKMNLEARKPRELNQENRKAGNFFHFSWIPGFQSSCFPAFLIYVCIGR